MKSVFRRRRIPSIAVACALLATVLFGGGTAGATPTPATPDAQRNPELGEGWWKSTDRVVEARADSGGYHLSVAFGADAFAWQPLATIRPAGFDTGTWTGYSCLTGSGNHVVAVVAPGYFANSPVLRDRGAFAYVVDVPSGQVRPLVGGVALKYHTPRCGAGDDAVLTRNPGFDQQSTQLLQVDAGQARVTRTVTVGAQLTSAVPDRSGAILAASGKRLVGVDATGKMTDLAQTSGQVYDIVPRADGSVGFLVGRGGDAVVYRLATRRLTELAKGPVGRTHLFAARGGPTR